MTLLGKFLLKDFNEVRNSFKVLIVILLSITLPTILNMIATNPVLPIETLMTPVAIFSACISAEILFFLMINEVKYKMFDVFLVSRISKIKLVLCRVAFPIIIGFVCAILGVFLNNFIVGIFVDYGYVSITFNIVIAIVFLVSAILSSLIEFLVIIFNGNTDVQKHTLTIALTYLLNIIIYITLIKYGILIYGIVSVFSIIVLIIVACNLIRLYSKPSKIKLSSSCLFKFPNENISLISGLIRKEIIVSEINIFTLVYLIIVSFFPTMIVSGNLYDIELLKFTQRITLFFISYFGVSRVTFKVLSEEQINRYSDIFSLVKVNKSKLYFSKSCIPLIIAILGFLLSLFIAILINDFNEITLFFNFVSLGVCVLSTLSSVIICFCLCKSIKTYQDIRIIELGIMATSFFAHIGICIVFSLIL